MRFESYSFGAITIDGVTYEHDVVIDHGSISKRSKRPSKPYRDQFGHTPLSAKEDLPWSCERLVIGTGASGSLPVMDDVLREAERRGVEVIATPTKQAMDLLSKHPKKTNAVLHVTC